MPQAIEGVGTTLTIGSATLCFVSLQGIGVDGGDKLDATCLDNSTWKTYLPQTLKEVPDLSFTAAFAPDELAGVIAEVNVNQQIVISYNYQNVSLGTATVWGYLKDFQPDEGTVGERWTASGTIVITNMNGSNAETGPVFT